MTDAIFQLSTLGLQPPRIDGEQFWSHQQDLRLYGGAEPAIQQWEHSDVEPFSMRWKPNAR